MVNEHQLRVAGKLEQVPNVCNWVVQVAEETGLGMQAVNHLELAVDEAVTNIIEHGYGPDGASKSIELVIREDGSHFKVIIIDEGPPFNPLQSAEPDPLTSLDDRPDYGGGWGLFFIKKVMDTVDYEYTANRNHLTMVKRID
jgi:serine/threonine-protein kinase RsbW